SKLPEEPSLAGKHIPLFGQALPTGKDELFLFGAHELARRACPQRLLEVKDPYAFLIATDAMEPRLRINDVIYLDPSRMPRREDDVLVQVEDGDQTLATIREFVGNTNGKLTLQSLNPLKKTTINMNKVKAIHVVCVIERP